MTYDHQPSATTEAFNV